MTYARGWGGRFYYETPHGRVKPYHPSEYSMLSSYLGRQVGREEVNNSQELKKIIGYSSDTICLDCLKIFQADLRDENSLFTWRHFYGCPTLEDIASRVFSVKDQRICPSCGSHNVKTIMELLGSKCPICGEGVIKEIITGIWT